ncbi:hypothetical protein OAT67_03535 [Bacteriovoracaceae bacterium]|nr:hypothetical protein [Bacteriovoracaceae bacterium]|tara:strand:- start:59942 stop:60475 length:534 start_codon:yes stop_codon:yes gene_type:complete
MSLVNTIKDQVTFGFTGKINILTKESGQYLGAVYLLDGQIVNCHYKDGSGRHSLFKVVFEDIDDDGLLKFIAEPEIINEGDILFQLSFNEFKTSAESEYNKFKSSTKLRPPADLKILIKSDFILEGDHISIREFDVLSLISDYNKVSEVYENSPLSENDITTILVSLRKMNALRVIK